MIVSDGVAISEGAAVFAVIINVLAIVWGAAKLSSAVDHLETTVTDIKSIVMTTQEIVHNTVGRLWVVEDRLDIPHRRITDAKGSDD